MNSHKPILWTVLSSFIILTQTIFAAPWFGSGIESDPYQITDAVDLLALGSDPNYYSDYFILVNDIDLSLAGSFTMAIIAPDMNDINGTVFEGTPFTGSFDGDGHRISNLSIVSDKDHLGLFGQIGTFGSEDGVVKNLEIADCNVIGDQLISPLAGLNNGAVSNCRASGDVAGNTHVGGMVGFNYGLISDCYSTCSITGNAYLGGLMGYNAGNVSSCWANGNVSGPSIGGTSSFEGTHVGGLAGVDSAGVMSDCYATGSVYGEGNVGGLVGFASNGTVLLNCYATGEIRGVFFGSFGALVGNFSSGSVTGCFWNTETSYMSRGLGNVSPDPNGVTGLDDPNMMIQTNFVGWDFVDEDENGTEDIWQMPLGGGYPELIWHVKPIPFGGRGTPENPYRISTAEELLQIKDFPEEYDRHFILINDINMFSEGPFTEAIIAPDSNNANQQFDGSPFTGVFDGQGYSITGLTITGGVYVNDFIGLFGQVGASNVPLIPGHIKNLGITDCDISGDKYVGGLVARIQPGQISNCFVTGQVSGSYFTGGLTGYIQGSYSNISKSYTTCNMGGTWPWSIGGLVGENHSTISNCYATGNVTGYYYIGGLTGQNRGTLSNCYATGTVSGLSGDNDIGGLVGYWGVVANAENCFWNTTASGTIDGVGNEEPDPAGITGLDDPNMMIQANFVGWDFVGEDTNGENEIWRMCVDGVHYPRLSWEFAQNGDFACNDGVDIFDLQALAAEWLTAAEITPTTFNYACEANGDEKIDLQDFSVLGNNW